MRQPIKRNDLHGNVPDHYPVALLLVDVLNDLDFPGGEKLLTKAPALGKNIGALKRRCRKVGIPAIYVNDNRGRWRSDASDLVKQCLSDDAPGRTLVEPLLPLPDDYIVLKPKHSAFYATPLDALPSKRFSIERKPPKKAAGKGKASQGRRKRALLKTYGLGTRECELQK
jgi:isochorismate hydrolase